MALKLTEVAADAQAQALFYGFARHFASIDAHLTYTAVERAVVLPLSPSILLAGIIDAEGEDFFSEHKSANPREAKTWKKDWYLSPQALTYGLLTGGAKKYLVRKAFKSSPPTYDHEWFAFNQHDLRFWTRQVLSIGQEILTLRESGAFPWRTNISRGGCWLYGANYPCPYWEHGCRHVDFDGHIPGSLPFSAFPEFEGENRKILLQSIEAMVSSTGREPLVLTATRIDNYLRCPEKYRRDQLMSFAPGEALILGKRFHELLASYYRGRIK